MLRRVAAFVALVLLASGCAALAPPQVERTASTASAAPTEPPARMCAGTAPGPAQAPPGAVTVNPAVDSDLWAKTEANDAGTTFWLAPGVHTLGTHYFGQVIPRDNNTYLGAPGAVLDGRGVNAYAFTQQASGVRIAHLEVRGFIPPLDEGVVNHDSGPGWTIEHNLIHDNRGAAIMGGVDSVIRANCLRDGGQYALNSFGSNVLLEGNEITGNNADDVENQVPGGCGCSGGMKFWDVDGATIRGNWIHGNAGVGIWVDQNNNDFLIEGNLIEGNDAEAIFYETSYNAVIRDNTIRNNTWVKGRQFSDGGDDFPVPAIYISESGGESRLPARTDQIEIVGNILENNWSGITLWENADRFCNSPANTSTGYCTELLGGWGQTEQCVQPGIASEPLYSDCRWKTKRANIHGNTFRHDPAAIDGGCPAGFCGRMSLLSNYGTYPDWSPYMGRTVQDAITFSQSNRWHDNAYTGAWRFLPYETGKPPITAEQWQAAPYGQDAGSTWDAAPPPPPPPTSSTAAPPPPPTSSPAPPPPPPPPTSTTAPPPPPASTEDAIRADPALSDAEEAALLGVYRCFADGC